jgi:hypothetical protein
LHIESDAFGTIENGTDGEVVWYLADGTGPIVQEGAARAAGLRDATFDLPVRWRDLYARAEYAGEGTVEGKNCHKIKLIPNEGEPETHLYDKESGLLLKVEKTRLFAGMPPMPVVVTYDDYRWVDGLRIPHKVRQATQQCGSTREMLFLAESVEHNADLPPDRFDLPPAVKAASAKLASGASGNTTGSACGGGASPTTADGGSPASAGGGCGGARAAAATEATTQPAQTSSGCGGG